MVEGSGPQSARTDRRRQRIDKVISTSLLVVATVAAAMVMISAVMPAIARSGNAITRSSARVDDRIETQVSIVYGTAELDSNGAWQDTDSDSYFDVWVWVKDVGASRIIGIDQTDVFFGVTGNFIRVPHVNDAGGAYPSWSYTVENGTEWENSVTIKITIHYEAAKASDTYEVKVVVPPGAYDDHFFSF